MNIIANNQELLSFVSTMDVNQDFFAIKSKGEIKVFQSKRTFNKEVKKSPNAISGIINYNNFSCFKF